MTTSLERTVHCADALVWLRENPLPAGASILTSLPDAVEFTHRDPERWRSWFLAAAEAVLAAAPPRAAAVFYQTDTRRGGRWTDKAFLVQQAAAAKGSHLLWHKVVCRAPAGTATGGRPGYAHLLCFSRELRDQGPPSPDVLPSLGRMTWPRAIGLDAARFAVAWLRDHAAARCVVDPFCGVGTALAVANGLGLPAIGVEKNPGRAARARDLVVDFRRRHRRFPRHSGRHRSTTTPKGIRNQEPAARRPIDADLSSRSQTMAVTLFQQHLRSLKKEAQMLDRLDALHVLEAMIAAAEDPDVDRYDELPLLIDMLPDGFRGRIGLTPSSRDSDWP